MLQLIINAGLIINKKIWSKYEDYFHLLFEYNLRGTLREHSESAVRKFDDSAHTFPHGVKCVDLEE